ncbi:DEAD/DEAH box helicase [Brooklawnia cerclae]|uniref:Superfamily II DNA/RNA helicase n=1 Tax=Brooklawnia cerclae TaxID=349934 RepID=A0ABX0SGS1_9ACTN|nr:DEAD/DEAH box helicase [Brooklawnia cerclae]NIH57166.1 superfamily II DNA/RNA helicase [Brooklawnia cerclae]
MTQLFDPGSSARAPKTSARRSAPPERPNESASRRGASSRKRAGSAASAVPASRPQAGRAPRPVAVAQEGPAQSWASLGVPAPIAGALISQGKATAFPIQADTLPDTLAGRDVLGRGRTGSGKTLAFAIPLVARLAAHSGSANTPRRPRGLVLAPTRELATQIDEVIAPLAAACGLRSTTIFGGVKQARQEHALARGAEIIVACPGRLEDLLGQRILTLKDICVTVIDEADLMADMGFLPGVTRILDATPRSGQRMLFSATLDNGVDRLVERFLDHPVRHSVDSAESPVDTMTHHVFEVGGSDDKAKLIEALASGTGRRILFYRTKHRAKRAAKHLTAAGIPAVDLQGDLSQNARERHLAAFESGEVRVLAATDVAARGVDVDGVALVVHVDPPVEHKEYLHRSGRTARAGNVGDVVTICLPEERRDLAAVLRRAKIRVTPQRVVANSPEVTELVGERAPRVAPAPVKATPQSRSRHEPRGGQQVGRDGRPGSGRSHHGRRGRA